MPWFRLDQNFADHPKVYAAGNAAVGAWVRCGTYSASYLTDGRIPLDIARRYGKAREIAAAIDAGLWVENGAGLVIPDYLEYNPSKEQVEAERARARERMARHRRGEKFG